MAKLKHLASGTEVYLGARHLVGRASTCQLRLDADLISGIHAEFVWDGLGWRLQDLGSRNGTLVDGRKLEAGEQAVLSEGAVVTFAVAEQRYQVTDAAPPRLMATPDRGAIVFGELDMLCLPTAETCEASIFRSGQGWVCETEGGVRELEDHGVVVAGARAWRISLPTCVAKTRDANVGPELHSSLATVALAFSVSRDGEHVSVEAIDATGRHPLEAHAHLFLLLSLARARLTDRAQDHLPSSEHGWVYRDELIETLAIDGSLLNLWVFRARKQLGKVGIDDPGGLIERRPQTQQLRIGVAQLEVHSA